MGTELGRKDDLDSAVLAQSVGLQGEPRLGPTHSRSCAAVVR